MWGMNTHVKMLTKSDKLNQGTEWQRFKEGQWMDTQEW